MSNEVEQNLEGIAVIGMSIRVPGSRTLDQFWENLAGGVESISFFTEEELIEAGCDPEQVRKPNYVRARGVLGDTDMADAAFFGQSPREAALMDPQHRLFLECAWEAFEAAGYRPSDDGHRVGVFGGQSMNTYFLTNVYPSLSHVASAESLQASIGNDKDSLTTEVAYRMNLTGPAVTVQSSSSTSLTCIHYACQSLLAFECDTALAGGVSIHFPEKMGYLYHEGGTTSSDGHCHTFDHRADGFVAGSGCGVVCLKRLEDAVADGDTIYAVVKGSSVNNDGSQKVSYMAPSVDGQAEVVANAQAIAGIEPESVSMIECHGTATNVGDPIEVASLTQAFAEGTDKVGFCALGSVKTNIGHLDSAAGAVGFIKASLSLKHGKIPPSLNFEKPNPQIDFETSPFFVNTELRDFPERDEPRRAGVTSLGMGGTNAHVILEEPPVLEASGEGRDHELLVLSAKTTTALDTLCDQLADYLERHDELPLADVAFTANRGRQRFAQRRAVVVADRAEAIEALRHRYADKVSDRFQEARTRKLVFAFPGQGAQYANMAADLYEREQVFRDELDNCCDLLLPLLKQDLRQILFPNQAGEDAEARLRETAITQPAVFAISYSLARTLMAWGLEPNAMIGHSIGQYVAATLAEVLSLEDALRLVATRGAMINDLPTGSMLSTNLSEDDLRARLGNELSPAVINGATNTVAAGPDEAIDALERQLESEGATVRRLHTSHAYHSQMLDPILGGFGQLVAGFHLQEPQLPFISNVTGDWITPEEATDPQYWVRHLRETVRFHDGLSKVLEDPDAVIVEVGPGQTLSTLASRHAAFAETHATVATLRHPREQIDDQRFLLRALGNLCLNAVEPDWSGYFGEQVRCRVPLPNYPFERQRYWIEAAPAHARKGESMASPDMKQNLDDWFYLPSWRLEKAGEPGSPKCVLVLAQDDEPLSQALMAELERRGTTFVRVAAGDDFERIESDRYTIRAEDDGDYLALVQGLKMEGLLPDHVLHLWGAVREEAVDEDALDNALSQGFYALAYLARALSKLGGEGERRVTVMAHGARQVTADEAVRPHRATTLGMCRSLAQEMPDFQVRHIDVSPQTPARVLQRSAAVLLDDALAEGPMSVAYRGTQRWVETFEGLSVPSVGDAAPSAKHWLILGGMGDVGYNLAESLAGPGVCLTLTGRRELPSQGQWDSIAGDDWRAERIAGIRALEAKGAKVWYVASDLTDAAALSACVQNARETMGGLNRVVHCAGVVGKDLFKTIDELDVAHAELHFAAKARSLYHLRRAVAGLQLDGVWLISSLAAELGGLGMAAYSAANLFMDSFAQVQNAENGDTPWLSLALDGWRKTAEANWTGAGKNPLSELAISEAEGHDLFARLRTLTVEGRLLVATSDLNARAARWLHPDQKPESETSAATSGRMPRPNLQQSYVPPADDVQRTICGVLEEVLALEQVGIHDNFFDLGGNSLLGVQVIALLKERLGIQLSALSLYEGPSVSALAALIAESQGEAPAAEAEEAANEVRDRGARRRAKRQGRRKG